MKHLPIIDDAFKQSSVNTYIIYVYLDAIPNYLEAGLNQGVGRYSLKLLNHVDFFEFALKRYISGRAKTMHGVFREVQQFRQVSEHDANHMIAFSLEAVKTIILSHQWFELMARYDQAVKKIQNRFKIDLSAHLQEAGFELSEQLT